MAIGPRQLESTLTVEDIAKLDRYEQDIDKKLLREHGGAERTVVEIVAPAGFDVRLLPKLKERYCKPGNDSWGNITHRSGGDQRVYDQREASMQYLKFYKREPRAGSVQWESGSFGRPYE